MAEQQEPYNPCAAFVELQNAHRKLLVGESVKRVRFRNGEDERETDFTPANIEALERAMNQAKRECAELTSGRPQRHAIGIGPVGGPRGGRIYS